MIVVKSHRTSSGTCNGRSGRRHEVPVYEFVCGDCGPFEQQRSFAEAGEPMACPSCGREARRVYSMPNTRRMPTALSGAMDRAEKSAHEPEVTRRPVGGTRPGKRGNQGHGRPWTLGH